MCVCFCVCFKLAFSFNSAQRRNTTQQISQYKWYRILSCRFIHSPLCRTEVVAGCKRRFGDEGCQKLCNGLHGNKTLLSLSMTFCDLGVDSGAILGKLIVNSAIRWKMCSWHKILPAIKILNILHWFSVLYCTHIYYSI